VHFAPRARLRFVVPSGHVPLNGNTPSQIHGFSRCFHGPFMPPRKRCKIKKNILNCGGNKKRPPLRALDWHKRVSQIMANRSLEWFRPNRLATHLPRIPQFKRNSTRKVVFIYPPMVEFGTALLFFQGWRQDNGNRSDANSKLTKIDRDIQIIYLSHTRDKTSLMSVSDPNVSW